MKSLTVRFGSRLAGAALLMFLPVQAGAAQIDAQTLLDPLLNSIVPSAEPTLSPRQKEIMRIVRAGDGYVTEELHREFWSGMPFDDRQMANATRVIQQMIAAARGPARNLGYETWLSAKMSLKAGQIVRSPGLPSAIAATKRLSTDGAYRNAASQSVRSVERILSAAASGTPLETANGPIFINLDLIDATLAGIDGGARRLEILLDPQWNAPLELYRHEDVHISTLSPWAFTLETSDLTLAGGRKGTLHSLSRTISDSQVVLISFADYGKGPAGQQVTWLDPTGTAIRNVQASLGSVGARGTVPHGEIWRGLTSATASGTASDATGKVHVSIRNVYLPNHKGFLTFMAVSQVSLFDSQQLLDRLEAQTQVLK